MAGTPEGAARARAMRAQQLAAMKEAQAAAKATADAQAQAAPIPLTIPKPKRKPGRPRKARLIAEYLGPPAHLVEPGEQQPQQSTEPPAMENKSVETPVVLDGEIAGVQQTSVATVENKGEIRAEFHQSNPALVPNLLNAAAPEMALVLIGLARARKTPAGVRMEAASRVLGLAGYVAPSSKDAKGSSAPDALETVKLLPAVVRVLELRRTAEGATDAELVPNQSRQSAG